MDDKIIIIMRRISELQGFLREGRGDPKWIRSMIEINEKILTRLNAGEDIRFYKISESIEDQDPSGFFLPTIKTLNNFLDVMN